MLNPFYGNNNNPSLSFGSWDAGITWTGSSVPLVHNMYRYKYILSACCCTDTNFTIEMFQSCTSHLKVGYSAYGMDGVHTDDVEGDGWGSV